MRLINIIPLIFLLPSCNQSYEVLKPRVGPITESVYASVTVQPDSLYASYATVSGIISEIFIEEGEEVKKGSKMLQITNDAQALYTTNAKLAFDLVKKKDWQWRSIKRFRRGNKSRSIKLSIRFN